MPWINLSEMSEKQIIELAAAIGLLLFTVYELDHPFQGDVHVQPDGFELVLEQFGAAS